VTVKEQVLAKLEKLPDSVTLTQMREELEIIEAIEKGQKAAREGRVKTQAEVESLFESWLTK
jgi:predicted transcriptional regulator